MADDDVLGARDPADPDPSADPTLDQARDPAPDQARDPAPDQARDPAPEPRRAPVWGALSVVLVLVLAGFLFAANARLAETQDGRNPQDLPGLVQVELARTDALATQVADLRAEVDRLTDAVQQNVPRTDEDGDLLALQSGQVAVTGPGLVVELTDAPANLPRPSWATNDHLVVHQQDLQAVINALWAGGADAMALQDQRVISTSAFRCVGNVLLLHGRHYGPPYVVSAIGDPEELRAALLASPGIQQYLEYVDAVGLGWSVSERTDLELPAYSGSLSLRYATAGDQVVAASP
ncbi:DUF881 domain-containing protein [Actinotalea sp. K2]|uniref:DUF881 domain-containing protein n=1 Tax=Actinotalea sp. K2 TaxID=2939438 RepID=UPI002016BF7C|nr:DUF881 domain-containing protein [Actinotalea sp. K2]MCL3860778.1 DUF881 domain-containing protein [Actinotalea sp. K2]